MAAFAGARFALSVVATAGLPAETGPEVAFVGRSNAGKSSAINRMVGQTGLAFASKLPGRTRELNFFHLRQGGYLVDLPGYGFARTPRNKQRTWSDVIDAYLVDRHALTLVVLVMDIRHAPSELDLAFLDWLRTARPNPLPVLHLLSKVDKLTQSERMKAVRHVRSALGSRLGPTDLLQPFSAVNGGGLRECDDFVGRLIGTVATTERPAREQGKQEKAPGTHGGEG